MRNRIDYSRDGELLIASHHLHRGVGKAQKIRMRLGGSPNMREAFPDKPKGNCQAQDVDLLFRRGTHEKREIGFGVNTISIDRAIEQARQRLRPASTAQVCNAEFRP